jgi:hypothetical protein
MEQMMQRGPISIKFFRFPVILLIALAVTLLIVLSTTVQAGGFSTYQVTDSTGNNSNIDAATDSSGNPHAVYERDGNIYYKAGIGSEELVGAGTQPAIAIGPDDIPQVVFLNEGNIIFTRKNGANWETPVTVIAASYADLDVDSNNHAHIVFLAKVAPDNYVDVAYINNTSGSFDLPTIIWNGNYYDYGGGSGAGYYYANPRIKIDNNDIYHIIAVYTYYDKWMSGTYRSITVAYKTNSGAGYECGSSDRGNKAINLSSNPLTVSSDGTTHVLYTQNGTTYYANPSSSWAETSLGSITQPAVASKGNSIGLAYVSGTDVMYMSDTGEGFDAPVLIDTGSSPAVALGSTFIYYLKSDGTNNEVYLQTDAVMESAPSVTQAPSDATVTYGENAVFTAEANGSPAPSVQWQVSTDGGENFSDIEDATGTTLTVSIPTVADSENQYRAVFTNSLGSATSSAATLTVNAAAITPTVTVDNKVYDGNSDAVILSRSLTGVVGDDDVVLTGGTASFANKNVETGKTVTITGLSLSGTDIANYELSSTTAVTTAEITPATLVPEITVDNKTYDGTTAAVIIDRSLSGIIDGDEVTLSGGSAAFADKNAGTEKEVTATGLTLTGASSMNYELSSTTITTQADIEKANASVYLSSLSQTYNGSPKTATATTDPPGLVVNFTYNESSTAPVNAGNYTVVGTVNDTNYEGSANGTLAIGKADQTITFSSAQFSGLVYGDPDFLISAEASSGLEVSFTSDGHCTVSGNTIHITGAGECTVTASQSGDNNYNAAVDISHSFTVDKATANISLSGLTFTYNGSAQYVMVTTDPPGVNYAVTYSRGGVPVENPVEAGSYAVQVVIEDDNYTGDPESATLVISKATPIINWPNPVEIAYGTPLSSAQLNASAEIDGSFEYTPEAGTVLEPGDNQTLSVVFTPVDTANYNAATKEVTINVTRALPDIAVSSSANPSTPGQTVTFTATVTSNAGTPAGEVIFSDGETVLDTVTLVEGQATFTTSDLSTGLHAISIEYSGDGYFLAGSSDTLIQRVNTPYVPVPGPSLTAVTLEGFSSPFTMMVDDYGTAQSSYRLQSQAGEVSIDIPAGSRLRDSTGSKLSAFSMRIPETIPAPPSNNALVLGYTFGPSGASFDPGLTLTLKYDPLTLPAGVAEEDLYMAYFDGDKWQILESTVDTQSKTVTARITHFSLYAIMGKISSPEVTPSPETTPSQTLTPAVSPSTVPEPTTEIPPAGTPPVQTTAGPSLTPTPTEPAQTNNLPLIIGIIAAVIVIGLVVMVLVRKKAR